MLPPEAVRGRRREGKLVLSPLSAAERERAQELGTALRRVTEALIGATREEVELAWAGVPAAAKDRKLRLGLTHLIEGRCDFATPAGLEPGTLRSSLFLRAAERRKSLSDDEAFSADSVIEPLASELACTAKQLKEALFSDLRAEQKLMRADLPRGEALVFEYELLQVQTVLLRAVAIEVELWGGSPDAYRALFRKLKFRQLLYRIEPRASGGYRLRIDGPLSLFEATTKYGLELSLSLPALLECGSLRLAADLRWGARREALRFELSQTGVASARGDDGGLRSDVAELLTALEASGSRWQARVSERLLVSEGDVLVPDLELSHPEGGTILVELLGFWSRDAVFRRIEASERGLGAERALFVVSSRLRVSEALLDDAESASLYVYKGRINVAALLRKLEALRDKGARATRSLRLTAEPALAMKASEAALRPTTGKVQRIKP